MAKTILARVLTEDLWHKYKDMRDRYGFSFKQAIFPGVRNPHAEGGAYAGSEDSFLAFYELYERIINDMYGP